MPSIWTLFRRDKPKEATFWWPSISGDGILASDWLMTLVCVYYLSLFLFTCWPTFNALVTVTGSSLLVLHPQNKPDAVLREEIVSWCQLWWACAGNVSGSMQIVAGNGRPRFWPLSLVSLLDVSLTFAPTQRLAHFCTWILYFVAESLHYNSPA